MNKLFREINKLPPKCKEIVLASFIEGKTAIEIAQEKEITRRTVESQLHKALKILRDALILIILFFQFRVRKLIQVVIWRIVFDVKVYPDMSYSPTTLVSGKVHLTSCDEEGGIRMGVPEK